MKMKVNPKNPGIEKKLKPLNERPVEEARKIQSKGGRTMTERRRKSLALTGWKNKLRNGSLTNKDMGWLQEQLMDDKAMSINMLDWMERYKNKVIEQGELKDMHMFAQVQNMLFKSIHGERVKVQSVNVRVNAGDEWANDILESAFGKRTKDVDVESVEVEVEDVEP